MLEFEILLGWKCGNKNQQTVQNSCKRAYTITWLQLFINILGPQFLWLGLKGFIQFFELEEPGASEAHKTESLDYEVQKI